LIEEEEEEEEEEGVKNGKLNTALMNCNIFKKVKQTIKDWGNSIKK
jgi:hypothetical protein